MNHVSCILGGDGKGNMLPAAVIYAPPSPKYSTKHPPPKDFLYVETPTGKS